MSSFTIAYSGVNVEWIHNADGSYTEEDYPFSGGPVLGPLYSTGYGNPTDDGPPDQFYLETAYGGDSVNGELYGGSITLSQGVGNLGWTTVGIANEISIGNNIIVHNGDLIVDGGEAINTTVNSLGELAITSGADSGTIINQGGVESSNGTTIDATIDGGVLNSNGSVVGSLKFDNSIGGDDDTDQYYSNIDNLSDVVIDGFAENDYLNFLTIHATSDVYNPNIGILTLYEPSANGVSSIGTLHFAGHYTQSSFELNPNENTEGTVITVSTPPIYKIALVLNETSGGFGTLTVTKNGQSLNINGNSNVVGVSIDPTMPLPNGSYDLDYYVSVRQHAPCLYVNNTFPDGRSNIEIHIGNSPGDSQGCIVFGNVLVNGTGGNSAYKKFITDLNEIASAEKLSEANGAYNFNNPITLKVSGCVQPLLSLTPAALSVTKGSPATISIRDGATGATPFVDRDIEIWFKIKGLTAGQASDVTGATFKANGDYDGKFKGDYELVLPGNDSWSGDSIGSNGSTSESFSINTTGIESKGLKVKIAGYDEVRYPWKTGIPKSYTPPAQPMLKGVQSATINITAPISSQIAGELLPNVSNVGCYNSGAFADAASPHLLRNDFGYIPPDPNLVWSSSPQALL